jgi:hypothetical protein
MPYLQDFQLQPFTVAPTPAPRSRYGCPPAASRCCNTMSSSSLCLKLVEYQTLRISRSRVILLFRHLESPSSQHVKHYLPSIFFRSKHKLASIRIASDTHKSSRQLGNAPISAARTSNDVYPTQLGLPCQVNDDDRVLPRRFAVIGETAYLRCAAAYDASN